MGDPGKPRFVHQRTEKAAAEQLLEDAFPDAFKRSFKGMLENSGLYQNHRIEAPNEYSQRLFELHHDDGARAQLRGAMLDVPVQARVPDAELDCFMCKSKKLFRCEALDLLYRREVEECEQIFSLLYQCHECEKFRIAFQLVRVGLKLQLTGRSLAYRPKVSADWAKSVRKIAQDALAAVGEGDLAAGYYHLRTAIEHDMKARVNIPLTYKIEGTDLCQQYNNTVEEEFKKRFPSFASLYSALSAGMHSREVTLVDFERLFADVEKHLHGRKIFDDFPRTS